MIGMNGCTSLETFPNGLKPHHTHRTHLFFLNCFKLAGQSDMFINVLRMLLTIHQEICKQSIISYPFGSFNIVIPGSEIPKWFSHQSIEVRFQWDSNYFLEVNKCGFRMVYEQDIEDIREMISAQSSNSTCITPYEGLDIHHDFHNSTEAIKMKRSRDEYEGAGASGEGSSNNVPHSKRIER
nr:hypothetical protein CFP56_24175 [Quercus suber]